MNVVVMVTIFPRHIASWIDPIQDGESGPGLLNGDKFTVAEQKTMNVPVTGPIGTRDGAFRVDVEGDGEIGPRCVDGRKGALAQQKAMNSEATAVQIKTHDVASRVDPVRGGKDSSRHIDCRELRGY